MDYFAGISMIKWRMFFAIIMNIMPNDYNNNTYIIIHQTWLAGEYPKQKRMFIAAGKKTKLSWGSSIAMLDDRMALWPYLVNGDDY